MDGGYDVGYRACPCFWGKEPGSFVRKLATRVSVKGLTVFDVGCGEGKNLAFLASMGARGLGIDVSDIAIEHARKLWLENLDVSWKVADVRNQNFDTEFDVVIGYGLLHCLRNEIEISDVLKKLQRCTASNGYIIIATLNSRRTDLSAHPELKACLLPHEWYSSFFSDWEVIDCIDSDLTESHPHNKVWHTHAITRILARKPN